MTRLTETQTAPPPIPGNPAWHEIADRRPRPAALRKKYSPTGLLTRSRPPGLAGGMEHLLAESPVRKLNKQAMLINVGDEANYFYEILFGQVKSYILLTDGRRLITGFHRKGDILGVPFEKKYSFSAQAVSRADVRCYSCARIEQNIGTSSALSLKLLDIASKQLSHATNQMVLLGRKNPVEKIATFLLSCERWASSSASQKVIIDLPMSRTDIADYLGLTQETVCRVLGQFKRCGLIEIDTPHQVRVHNMEALYSAAEKIE